MDFVKFPKIPRMSNVTARITEKLDGTNAQIVVQGGEVVAVGSRNRWITPGKTSDNYGFAQWVSEHWHVLSRLGEGTHYGEWYGQGIGRGCGLDHRRFALFEPERYPDIASRGLPSNVEVVPVLQISSVDQLAASIEATAAKLREAGSVAVPGFMRPEGIVITVFGNNIKLVFDKAGPSPEE